MNENKANVRVNVVSDDCYGAFDKSLVEFISFYQDKLEEIPEEHREDAKVNMEAYGCYDEYDIDMSVYYYRIPTEEEEKARQDNRHELTIRTMERERNEYERLKRKFEGEE